MPAVDFPPDDPPADPPDDGDEPGRPPLRSAVSVCPPPQVSAARVSHIAMNAWCFYNGVCDRPLESAALRPYDLSGDLHTALPAEAHTRVAHYGIMQTWDAYVALLDDFAFLLGAARERDRLRRLGDPEPDEEHVRREAARSGMVSALTTTRGELGLLVLDQPIEAGKPITGREKSQTRWTAWVDSIRLLRNHLVHGSGHIDYELRGSNIPSFTVTWLRLELTTLSRHVAGEIDEMACRDSQTIPLGNDQREFFRPRDRNAVQGILASIAYVAWLTYFEFMERYCPGFRRPTAS